MSFGVFPEKQIIWLFYNAKRAQYDAHFDHNTSIMATVKTTLDTRRPKADGAYNIIFKIRHYNKVYTINSGISTLEQYWDGEHSKITKQHPNSKLLNLKLLKDYFKIEKAMLTLDDDFTIEKLRNIFKGISPNTSKSFKKFNFD